MSDPELKELVPLSDGMIFNSEELGPIFCKPKLLPMKTISMEKLEQMQREAERVVLQSQKQAMETVAEESAEVETNEEAEKITEVWSADD